MGKTPRFRCRGARVQSLVGELKSCMLHGAAKKRKFFFARFSSVIFKVILTAQPGILK